ncbi:MAG: undecaprenyl-diphosphate phosphatase [Tropicimonas sp.]|uniref:undecaprenyl-diphosphate phosphatase n=1 Tax=Tropicimonas sp. TaxID=2067044 RepID=UPI003A84692E
MTYFHILLVAAIQGLTEFLPVSSSAHLILLPALSHMEDQGLTIDVATHIGTLLAVILYFRADVKMALSGVPDLLRGRMDSPGARLALLLVIATIPVVVVGFVLKLTGLEEAMRSVTVIGWTMLIFGLVLYWADRTGGSEHRAEDWTMKHAWVMGLWQAVALIPGTSRSGITITAARRLGYERSDAARLSMLMSIPTIIASGTLLGLDVIAEGNMALLRDASIAALFAFFAALLALSLMMRLLRSISFTPYVVYRVVLGLVLLWIAYS